MPILPPVRSWANGITNPLLIYNSKKKFHGLFPRRQLWRPALEYPLWDHNWDGRQPPPPTPRDDVEEDSRQTAEAQQRDRLIRKEGVTRHIILIRHGQYDETSQVRILPPYEARTNEQ
jgi:hypothetical protein